MDNPQDYKLNTKGETAEIGYVGKYAEYLYDPTEWCEKRRPDLIVHCAKARKGRGDRQLIAQFWRVPPARGARDILMETMYHPTHVLQTWWPGDPGEPTPPRPRPVAVYEITNDNWRTEDDKVRIHCPQHGWTRLPFDVLDAAVDSTRRKIEHDCTDPQGVIL